MDQIEAAVLSVQKQVTKASTPVQDALMTLFRELCSMDTSDSLLSLDICNQKRPKGKEEILNDEVQNTIGLIVRDPVPTQTGYEYLILTHEGLFWCPMLIWKRSQHRFGEFDRILSWPHRRPAHAIDWILYYDNIIRRCRDRAQDILDIQRFKSRMSA